MRLGENPQSAGSAQCVLRDGRLSGLLRMRNFLNAIKGNPHPEERPFETPPAAAPQDRLARLEGRKTVMQPFLSISCPASIRYSWSSSPGWTR